MGARRQRKLESEQEHLEYINELQELGSDEEYDEEYREQAEAVSQLTDRCRQGNETEKDYLEALQTEKDAEIAFRMERFVSNRMNLHPSGRKYTRKEKVEMRTKQKHIDAMSVSL